MKHIMQTMWRPVSAMLLALCLMFSTVGTALAMETIDTTYYENLADEIAATVEDGITEEEVEALYARLVEAYAYAEENGHIDIVKAELEAYIEEIKPEIEAYLNEIKPEIEAYLNEIKPEIEAAVAELEAELAELYAQLENASEELKAEIEAKIAQVEAKIAEIEAKLAELEAKVDNVIDVIETVYDYITNPEKIVDIIETEINKAIDELVAAAEELKAEVTAEIAAAIDELVETVTAKAEALVAAVENAVVDAYVNATAADYVVSDDSYYVALGDSSVTGFGLEDASAAYGALLAAELGLTEDQVALLGEDGLSADALLATIDTYADDLAKADLVTLGFSGNGMISFVSDQLYSLLMGSTPAEMDWAAYVGEENAAYVADALAEIEAYFVEAGVEGTIPSTNVSYIDALNLAIESYAYAYAGFLCSYPEIINEIHAINDDALVIIVGMYNPFDGLSLDMDGTLVALGDYMNYIVAATNVHTFTYALITDNTIYVDAPAVETISTTTDAVSVMDFVLDIMADDAQAYYAGENGHAYVKDQILGALNVSVEGDDDVVVDPAYDLGDINMDDSINMMDAILLYNQTSGQMVLPADQLAQADLNKDGSINMMDATILYQVAGGYMAL